MSKFRRKPEVIKLANKSINIAALSINQTVPESIEFANKSLFELLNPFNKYQKSISYNLVMKYKNLMDKKILFNFSDLKCVIERYSDESREKLKKRLEENDIIFALTIRKAFIDSLNCPAVVILTKDSTVNGVDFYFDTIKSYDKPCIEGIKIGEEGFINTSEFNLTVVVNSSYLLNIFTNYTMIDDYIKDLRASLWAAIIRDNMRMELTEKFALTTHLLTKIDMSCANELSAYYKAYTDEKTKKLVEEYSKIYENEISAINSVDCEDDECGKVDWLFSMLQSRLNDITPLNILTLFEGTDVAIAEVLKSSNLISSSANIFASSSKLLTVSEDVELEKVRKYILINRLFPIVFFDQFILKNGKKYDTFKQIDTEFEEYVHDVQAEFQYTKDLSRLALVHSSNDEYYDELRDSFKNPIRYSRVAIESFKRIVFKENRPQPVECGACVRIEEEGKEI